MSSTLNGSSVRRNNVKVNLTNRFPLPFPSSSSFPPSSPPPFLLLSSVPPPLLPLFLLPLLLFSPPLLSSSSLLLFSPSSPPSFFLSSSLPLPFLPSQGDVWICMELMDKSLHQLYKLVYDTLHVSIPEPVIGKMAESVCPV